MTKLTELYIKLTQVLKMQLYLKKENDKLTEQIRKEKLKEKNKFPKVLLLSGEKGSGKFTLSFHLINFFFLITIMINTI